MRFPYPRMPYLTVVPSLHALSIPALSIGKPLYLQIPYTPIPPLAFYTPFPLPAHSITRKKIVIGCFLTQAFSHPISILWYLRIIESRSIMHRIIFFQLVDNILTSINSRLKQTSKKFDFVVVVGLSANQKVETAKDTCTLCNVLQLLSRGAEEAKCS